MLNQNFSDMLSAFSEAGVEYLLIGIRHLYANKLATGRAKDQLDAQILAERLGKQLG
jgi:hypothetical protein